MSKLDDCKHHRHDSCVAMKHLSVSDIDIRLLEKDNVDPWSEQDKKSSSAVSPYSSLLDLPSDWLGACFDFLPLQDLLALTRTSNAFRTGGGITRMRTTPTITFGSVRLRDVPRLCHSALSCRINDLTVIDDFSTHKEQGFLSLPCNLRSLQLHTTMELRDKFVPHVQRVIDAVSSCTKLTCLELRMSKAEPHQVRLLSILPNSLTILTISGCRLELPQHIDAIRRLPQLTSLRVMSAMSPETLTYLLRAPFNLPLTNLDLTYTEFADAHAAALRSPLSLEQFTPWSSTLTSVKFLHMLPSLHTLHLLWRSGNAPSANHVLAELSSLSANKSLTDLRLSHVNLNGDHVMQLLTLLPELRVLSIQHAPNFRSFECFSVPGPHQEKLERVALSHLGGSACVPADETDHLWSLRAIRRIELVCVSELSWQQRRSFRNKFDHGGMYYCYTPWKKS